MLAGVNRGVHRVEARGEWALPLQVNLGGIIHCGGGAAVSFGEAGGVLAQPAGGYLVSPGHQTPNQRGTYSFLDIIGSTSIGNACRITSSLFWAASHNHADGTPLWWNAFISARYFCLNFMRLRWLRVARFGMFLSPYNSRLEIYSH